MNVTCFLKDFGRRLICLFCVGVFSFSTIELSFAQPVSVVPVVSSHPAEVFLKGVEVNEQNPFQFRFFLDFHDQMNSDDWLRDEGQKLIHYFLTALTIPEDDLWVNLSPYENNRIIDSDVAKTRMGQDLLTQDYLLKQITADILHPDHELGKSFWNSIYQRLYETQGISEVSQDLLSKVWILPRQAHVIQKKQLQAFVKTSSLKVLSEDDYIARARIDSDFRRDVSVSQSNIIQDIFESEILPVIENHINHSPEFSSLRQMYQAMILAVWYKQNIRNSMLSQTFVDQKHFQGFSVSDGQQETQHVYQQYLNLFEKGVQGYIREEYDPVHSELVARRYVVGGVKSVSRDDLSVDNDHAQLELGPGVYTFDVNLVSDQAQLTFHQAVNFLRDKNFTIIKGALNGTSYQIKKQGDQLLFGFVGRNAQITVTLHNNQRFQTGYIGGIKNDASEKAFRTFVSNYRKKISQTSRFNNLLKILMGSLNKQKLKPQKSQKLLPQFAGKNNLVKVKEIKAVEKGKKNKPDLRRQVPESLKAGFWRIIVTSLIVVALLFLTSKFVQNNDDIGQFYQNIPSVSQIWENFKNYFSDVEESNSVITPLIEAQDEFFRLSGLKEEFKNPHLVKLFFQEVDPLYQSADTLTNRLSAVVAPDIQAQQTSEAEVYRLMQNILIDDVFEVIDSPSDEAYRIDNLYQAYRYLLALNPRLLASVTGDSQWRVVSPDLKNIQSLFPLEVDLQTKKKHLKKMAVGVWTYVFGKNFVSQAEQYLATLDPVKRPHVQYLLLSKNLQALSDREKAISFLFRSHLLYDSKLNKTLFQQHGQFLDSLYLMSNLYKTQEEEIDSLFNLSIQDSESGDDLQWIVMLLTYNDDLRDFLVKQGGDFLGGPDLERARSMEEKAEKLLRWGQRVLMYDSDSSDDDSLGAEDRENLIRLLRGYIVDFYLDIRVKDNPLDDLIESFEFDVYETIDTDRVIKYPLPKKNQELELSTEKDQPETNPIYDWWNSLWNENETDRDVRAKEFQYEHYAEKISIDEGFEKFIFGYNLWGFISSEESVIESSFESVLGHIFTVQRAQEMLPGVFQALENGYHFGSAHFHKNVFFSDPQEREFLLNVRHSVQPSIESEYKFFILLAAIHQHNGKSDQFAFLKDLNIDFKNKSEKYGDLFDQLYFSVLNSIKTKENISSDKQAMLHFIQKMKKDISYAFPYNEISLEQAFKHETFNILNVQEIKKTLLDGGFIENRGGNYYVTPVYQGFDQSIKDHFEKHKIDFELQGEIIRWMNSSLKTARHLQNLSPLMKELSMEFINRANEELEHLRHIKKISLSMQINSGRRTDLEQDYLYQIGRTIRLDQNPWTNLSGTSKNKSNHQKGDAIDIDFYDGSQNGNLAAPYGVLYESDLEGDFKKNELIYEALKNVYLEKRGSVWVPSSNVRKLMSWKDIKLGDVELTGSEKKALYQILKRHDGYRQAYEVIARVGEELGFNWGGRWTRPFDPRHFELSKKQYSFQNYTRLKQMLNISTREAYYSQGYFTDLEDNDIFRTAKIGADHLFKNFDEYKRFIENFIWKESDYVEAIRSSQKASGLIQIIEPTWKRIPLVKKYKFDFQTYQSDGYINASAAQSYFIVIIKKLMTRFEEEINNGKLTRDEFLDYVAIAYNKGEYRSKTYFELIDEPYDDPRRLSSQDKNIRANRETRFYVIKNRYANAVREYYQLFGEHRDEYVMQEIFISYDLMYLQAKNIYFKEYKTKYKANKKNWDRLVRIFERLLESETVYLKGQLLGMQDVIEQDNIAFVRDFYSEKQWKKLAMNIALAQVIGQQFDNSSLTYGGIHLTSKSLDLIVDYDADDGFKNDLAQPMVFDGQTSDYPKIFYPVISNIQPLHAN